MAARPAPGCFDNASTFHVNITSKVARAAGHVFIQYVVTPQLFYCFGC